MNVIKKELGMDTATLVPLSDVHVGHRDFDESYFRSTVDWMVQKGAYTILLGDMIDGISKKDRRFENDSIDPKFRDKIDNLRFTLDRVTKQSGVTFSVHDLRRTFTTVADTLDVPHYALKRLLNHSMAADVTAGYIVSDVERLRGPMEKITNYFLKAGGLESGAEIVDLAERKAAQ